MGRRFDTISFLSDLGLVDETVGVVKAVVRDLAPHVVVVDLTHQIRPYDVRGGSLALARAIGYVPSGVVVASVDAGADLLRPHVAIEVAGGEGVMVGPDNGLLAPAVAMAGGAGRAVLLDDPEFHLASSGALLPARDLYAPVAAHLCNGVDLAELGRSVDADTLLPGVVPLPRDADDGGLAGEVLWVDHLGNCQLNVGTDDLAPWGAAEGVRLQVVAGDVIRVAERVDHPGRLGAGSVGLLVDPHGMLTLCLDRRSAAEELSLGPGDQVTLRPLAGGDRGPAVSSPVTLRTQRS
jgi:S-adenosyl-L-methionine hydrolase (adenosine-forming)